MDVISCAYKSCLCTFRHCRPYLFFTCIILESVDSRGVGSSLEVAWLASEGARGRGSSIGVHA